MSRGILTQRSAAVLAAALLLAACSENGSIEHPLQPPVPQREEFLALARSIHSSGNPYLGSTQIPQLQAQLNNPDLTPVMRADSLVKLCYEQLRWGHLEPAVAAIEEAAALSDTLELPVAFRIGLLRLQSLVYLRQAEVENCIQRHNADCCLLPLKSGGVHEAPAPAERAYQTLQRVLALNPSSLETRWLINLVAMALGTWPDGVRKDVLIPVEAYTSKVDLGRFVNVAPELGVDTFNECGGVVVEDFDGDGQLDIVTSSFGPDEPLTFYRGGPDMTFEDRSSASWLDDQLGGLNLIGAGRLVVR